MNNTVNVCILYYNTNVCAKMIGVLALFACVCFEKENVCVMYNNTKCVKITRNT